MDITEKYHKKAKKEKPEMEKKEKPEMEKEDEGCEMKEETAASDSIKAKPTDATSKAAMMAKTMNVMAGMNSQDLSSWLEQALALIGHEADTIPSDAAAKNAASVAMKGSAMDINLPNMGKAVKEDVAALFGDTELSEDFKEKTTTLFEAAVAARVIAEKAALEEAYEEALNESIDEIVESLADNIDKYMSYIAKEWAEENKVAIDKSLRADFAEEFIVGLRNLFAEHYIEFPEEKVDAVDVLVSENEELKEKLNENMKMNVELLSLVEEYAKESVFNDVSTGLALTQVDKFKSLAEGVEFDDIDGYKKKLEIIKENYLNKTPKAKPTSFITEEIENEDTAEVKYLDPQIAKYASAITRTIKR